MASERRGTLRDACFEGSQVGPASGADLTSFEG